MNKIFIVIAIAMTLFLGSCKSSKELKSLQEEHENLDQKFELQSSKLLALEKSKESLQAELEALQFKANTMENEWLECESNFQEINSMMSSHSAKLGKLKKELNEAFPNNLGEKNFSIIEEDGRLVISLPNSILYKSGEAEFDGKALEIIQKLAINFRNYPNLQVVVEGHTDDLPLNKNSKYADNWDLSLARSVKVVRALELYGVFPARLTAAGRGYFAPKSSLATDEARAMNRRTEIIIRPKVSEILKTLHDISEE